MALTMTTHRNCFSERPTSDAFTDRLGMYEFSLEARVMSSVRA